VTAVGDKRTFEYGRTGAGAYAALSDAMAPVSEAIVDRLPALATGSQVVDLACGPGEPGLSVLRRYPDVHVLGIDSSPDMLALARRRTDGMPNVRFHAMNIEDLELPPAGVDAVVSRFGFLTMEDTTRSTAGFARIARPGCAYSVAVWDRSELNPRAHALVESLRGRVDDELLPPLDELDARAAQGRPAAALREIGVAVLETELFTWSTATDNGDATWSNIISHGIKPAAAASLGPRGIDELRARYWERLERYVQADGTFLIPSSCRLLWGYV
jgi:trans-aconitate methyltransferase